MAPLIDQITPNEVDYPNVTQTDEQFETSASALFETHLPRFETEFNTSTSQTNAVYQDINAKYEQIQNNATAGGYSQSYIDNSQIAPYLQYTALGGETQLNVTDNTAIRVEKNGTLLAETTDYTLNVDGINIDFVVALSASNFIQVWRQNKLDNRFYTKEESDNQEVRLTGNQEIEDIKTFNSGIKLFNVIANTTFTNANNKILLTGLSVEQMAKLANIEIGDVLKIADAVSTGNNTEFTAEVLTAKWQNSESITTGDKRKSISTNVTYEATSTGTSSGADIQDDTGVSWQIATEEEIIVNQAHAGGTSTKSLTDEASTANVTIELLTKWYNASDTLGRGWVDVTSSRALATPYPNNTNRSFMVHAWVTGTNANGTITVSGAVRDEQYINTTVGAATKNVKAFAEPNQNYQIDVSAGSIVKVHEYR